MKTGTAIYKPGAEMQDLRPAAHRIRTIREPSGALLGFGVTAPGGQTIVTRHADMVAALAHLRDITDFTYGPLYRFEEKAA